MMSRAGVTANLSIFKIEKSSSDYKISSNAPNYLPIIVINL